MLGPHMIELSTLQDMFDEIRSNTSWNMDGPMLWGYYFTDRSAEKLQEVAAELEKDGYRYVDMFVPELDEGQEEYFFFACRENRDPLSRKSQCAKHGVL